MAKQETKPKWKDGTGTQRQRRRLERLRAVILPRGWSSESELMTALINGDVEAPINPLFDSVRSDGDLSE